MAGPPQNRIVITDTIIIESAAGALKSEIFIALFLPVFVQ